MQQGLTVGFGLLVAVLAFVAFSYADAHQAHPVTMAVAVVKAPVALVARMAAKRAPSGSVDGLKAVTRQADIHARDIAPGDVLGAVKDVTHVWDMTTRRMVPLPRTLGPVTGVFVPRKVGHASTMVQVTCGGYVFGIPSSKTVTVVG